MARKAKSTAGKSVESLRHQEAKRRNIPTAEYQSVIKKETEQPLRASTSGATETSPRSSSGAARTSRTGAPSSGASPAYAMKSGAN
jgi:hypothetical protein